MREETERPALERQFRLFARSVARDGNPLYEALCLGVADNETLLALLDPAAEDQRRPNLLLAAVHYLLLGGAEHPLARRYRTVVELQGLDPATVPATPDGAVAEFEDFCAVHQRALRELIATRATQTNEIGRCTGLLPGLAVVADRARRPLWVLDLGASAGLNLLFDRYRYEYRSAIDGSVEATAGDPGSPVALACELRAGHLPDLPLPPVAGRAGVDLRPVDVTHPDQVRWLLACQWPDDVERFWRQSAALDLAATLPRDVRPALTTGDLVATLPVMAAAASPEAALCVLHSWVAAYLTPDEQHALAEAVAIVSAQRPVYWLFAESPWEVPELPVAPPPDPDAEGDRAASALMLVELEGGAPRPHRLADMHHHGSWLRWWGPDHPNGPTALAGDR